MPDRIRRELPRYAGMSDREVLAADFALHDAQELLAIEHGFGSWARLKEAPPVNTRTTTTGEVTFLRAHPQVFVADVTRSASWYQDVLGFTIQYLYGEPPFYAGVERGGVVLNIRHVDASPWADDAHRDEEQLLTASIVVSDAKALFLQYRDAGADMHSSLKEQPWDSIEFVVRDPDGNLVLFGSPTS